MFISAVSTTCGGGDGGGIVPPLALAALTSFLEALPATVVVEERVVLTEKRAPEVDNFSRPHFERIFDFYGRPFYFFVFSWVFGLSTARVSSPAGVTDVLAPSAHINSDELACVVLSARARSLFRRAGRALAYHRYQRTRRCSVGRI